MKIIVVGATGILGTAVTKDLEKDHEVIKVGFNSGDVQVDISDIDSIRAMYEQVGSFDSLISTAGLVHFGSLGDITQEQWQLGLNNKLMGQINLVMEGLKDIDSEGSFTLTSGIVSQDPVRYGAAATTVCAAIEGFAASAALELPRGVRVNVVSPTIVEESVAVSGSAFSGFEPVPATLVASAFRKSVVGAKNGETIYVRGRV